MKIHNNFLELSAKEISDVCLSSDDERVTEKSISIYDVLIPVNNIILVIKEKNEILIVCKSCCDFYQTRDYSLHFDCQEKLLRTWEQIATLQGRCA